MQDLTIRKKFLENFEKCPKVIELEADIKNINDVTQ